MGKLHKIRHLYNKLDEEQKMAMAIYLDNGMQKKISKEKLKEVIDLVNFQKNPEKWRTPYHYYFKNLLSKDGFLKKEQNWTKRVSKLMYKKGNVFGF